MQIQVGIITISDRASQGLYDDLGGPALKAAAEAYGWKVLAQALVPDDKQDIQRAVREQVARGCQLILTTGGTGVALRDVTPEAVREIGGRELPGLRRSHAPGIDEAHPERHPLAQPGHRGGQGAGDLPAGQAERGRRVSWLCGRRPSPLVEVLQEVPTSC